METPKGTTIQCKITAMAKLIELAAKINIGHNVNNPAKEKYVISISKDAICIEPWKYTNFGTPWFYSKDAAQIAINILGEELIRTAYTQF